MNLAQFYVSGAGDNGMMTGYLSISGGTKPIYMTNSGFKDMTPAGWFGGQILDSWGATYHAGYGKLTETASSRALFWVGAGPAVNLHPAGAEYEGSVAMAVAGDRQAGSVSGVIPCEDCGFTSIQHACVWTRTAASFRRLHSTTHQDTRAWATDGTHYVGYGTHRGDSSTNALLWMNDTSMAINLRPSQSTYSSAFGVWGSQQGGAYIGPATSGHTHAVIWNGTPGSAMDLHPGPAFLTSQIEVVRSGTQAGWGSVASANRAQAIAWHSNAATWINLHARLPAMYQTWSSYATDIDGQGNIVGQVQSPDLQEVRPVVWLRS
jgi:hypothetical protein